MVDSPVVSAVDTPTELIQVYKNELESNSYSLSLVFESLSSWRLNREFAFNKWAEYDISEEILVVSELRRGSMPWPTTGARLSSMTEKNYATAKKHSIRKATPTDAPVLLDLFIAHAEYEQEDLQTEGKLEALQKCLSSNPQPFECILVESDGEVRGYCNYFVQYDSWACASHMLLDALYLKPELRGQGIGTEIMNIVKEAAQAAECKTVRWQTPVFNETGINFYKKLSNTISGTKMFFTWDV